MLLEVRNLSAFYGRVKALDDVSFSVNEGEIIAMIGPNGAGKSTTLKAICGLLEATNGYIAQGEILFEGNSIKDLRTHELVRKGISLIPEGRHVFSTMTVIENLEMGAYSISNNFWKIDFNKNKEKKHEVLRRMFEVFELFPILYEKKDKKAGTLSTGEQQMLAIGRAFMLKPKLLLADEPSLGLSPNFIDLIFDKLVEINKNGTSILLIEQNAYKALDVCHRGYIFEIGSIIMGEQRDALIRDRRVKEVYFGIQ